VLIIISIEVGEMFKLS